MLSIDYAPVQCSAGLFYSPVHARWALLFHELRLTWSYYPRSHKFIVPHTDKYRAGTKDNYSYYHPTFFIQQWQCYVDVPVEIDEGTEFFANRTAREAFPVSILGAFHFPEALNLIPVVTYEGLSEPSRKATIVWRAGKARMASPVNGWEHIDAPLLASFRKAAMATLESIDLGVAHFPGRVQACDLEYAWASEMIKASRGETVIDGGGGA